MANILIVDDSAELLEFLSLILKKKNNIVQAISNTTDLPVVLQVFAPDLILMDVRMSGDNGRDMCKSLKAAEATRNIRIVLMSASPNLLEDFAECSADAVLEKPFDIKLLYQTVDYTLATVSTVTMVSSET